MFFKQPPQQIFFRESLFLGFLAPVLPGTIFRKTLPLGRRGLPGLSDVGRQLRQQGTDEKAAFDLRMGNLQQGRIPDKLAV